MPKWSDYIRSLGTAGPATVQGIYALGFALRSEIPALFAKYVRVDAVQTFTTPEKLQGRTNLGLGNVDNTTDAAKPVSTATQTALDLKAPLASPGLTGNPTAPTQTAGNNSTRLATTAFVAAAIASLQTAAAAFVSAVTGFTAKATPADADIFGYVQASDTTGRNFTWANLKAALTTAFATVFAGTYGNGTVATTTATPSSVITGVLTTARKIEVEFAGVQPAGATQILFQLGVGGALVTTGYAGAGGRVAGAAGASLVSAAGLNLYTNAGTEVIGGKITATLVDISSNLWDIIIVGGSAQGPAIYAGTYIALAGAPDRVAIVAASGNLVAGGKLNMRQFT